MKNFKYDYGRTCFLKEKISNKESKYYLKVNLEYIEVSKESFKVCKSSYDKIGKDEKSKVDRFIFNLGYHRIVRCKLHQFMGTKERGIIHWI